MANFIEEFMQSFGPEVSREMSSNLGMSRKTANQVVPEVIPLILGGLKRQMETRGGADRANHILNKYGSPDVLGRIRDEFASRARDENPDPRLGGLLGEAGVEASNMMAKQHKLDSSLAMKIIPMLTPIILGALTNKRDNGGAGASGIAALIDQDGDGSILDDVAGFLVQGLAGSGRQRGGGLLGNLLGSLFGRKR